MERTGKTMRGMRGALALLLAAALAFCMAFLAACGPAGGGLERSSSDVLPPASPSASAAVSVQEGQEYTSKEEVALYLHEYGHLPGNFISKTKAKNAGWVSSKGNLDEVCPGKSIGGSVFYNDDGLLPDAPGRTWRECDVGYGGGYRGPERIVFSSDGLIYYTADHYRTFERLY